MVAFLFVNRKLGGLWILVNYDSFLMQLRQRLVPTGRLPNFNAFRLLYSESYCPAAPQVPQFGAGINRSVLITTITTPVESADSI
jgi:hypothetical protein